MRDQPPAHSRFPLYFTTARKYTVQSRTEIHCAIRHGYTLCNAIPRQSSIVEAHFRDADNNQQGSFQGRETLPLIEDSFVRGFRVKVQAPAADNQEEFALLANCFSFDAFNQTSQSLGYTYQNSRNIDYILIRCQLFHFSAVVNFIFPYDFPYISLDFGFHIFKANSRKRCQLFHFSGD